MNDPNPRNPTDEELAAWPNCSVPDCEYKSWRGGGSPMCHAHSHGRTPIPFEEYMKTPPIDDEEEIEIRRVKP